MVVPGCLLLHIQPWLGLWCQLPQGDAGHHRGMLAGVGEAGTFWSGVGTPQCIVRVMSVVPSLQMGDVNWDDAAPALDLGPPATTQCWGDGEGMGVCAVLGGGGCAKGYAQILPSGVRKVHLIHGQLPAAPVGGATRGRGVRARSQPPAAQSLLPALAPPALTGAEPYL